MRTKDKNPKAKEKLLDAALGLILQKGFTATSVDEICKAAKLTKGSFFHYFKSKDELGKVLLERFCCTSQGLMDGLNKAEDPLKRVYGYIACSTELFSDDKLGKGCLLGCFSQELADTHPEIRCLCEKGFDDWAKRIEQDMSAAKRKYAPQASFDPKSLAQHFIAVLEGAQILARAKRDRRIVKASLVHFKNYLDLLYRQK